jgi:hypothetical protein
MSKNDKLANSITFLLITQGSAKLRTGKRRTYKAAEKILQAAADEADIPVFVQRGNGFMEAVVEDR